MRVVVNLKEEELDLCYEPDLKEYLNANPDGFILVENAKCGKKCGAAESAISEVSEALELPSNILSFGKIIDCPALSKSGEPRLIIHRGGKIETSVEPSDTVWGNKSTIIKYFPEADEE